MVLGLEGRKEGVNLRGQYKLDPLNEAFSLTSWSCVDKKITPNLEGYAGQKNMPIPTKISLRTSFSM